MPSMIFSFFAAKFFFLLRNVDVETCVQEKVGKEKDMLGKHVETCIGIVQTFVTVARKLMARPWKCAKMEW